MQLNFKVKTRELTRKFRSIKTGEMFFHAIDGSLDNFIKVGKTTDNGFSYNAINLKTLNKSKFSPFTTVYKNEYITTKVDSLGINDWFVFYPDSDEVYCKLYDGTYISLEQDGLITTYSHSQITAGKHSEVYIVDVNREES